MSDFRDSDLWKRTLGPQPERDAGKRGRDSLRGAYLSTRVNAEALARQIEVDLPEFPLHDVSHSDALWGIGSLICGKRSEFNPLEGFVLGAAFLVHDLGMTAATNPDWPEECTSTTFRDIVGIRLRALLGRSPTVDELRNAPRDIVEDSAVVYLREAHARRSERVATEPYADESGCQRYLISDPGLRLHLGPLVGMLGHSHWWAVAELESRLPGSFDAPPGYVDDWQIDPIRLACVLRLADAAHLDESRAPARLMATSLLGREATEHWTFQSKLGPPTRSLDRIVFASVAPFAPSDARAWWKCRDLLQNLDDELVLVDGLLADTGRSRFAVRSVAGVRDPERLSRLVTTVGWLPQDTRIKVGDVAQLVDRMGGAALYGDDSSVVLRELIQNAADACRARRALESVAYRPTITLRMDRRGPADRLTVEDNGLGMTRRVLTGALLDFGKTYWGTDLMRTEHPGLAASSFQPTGQYGIGFFSAFMIADSVKVTTKPTSGGLDETYVLDFAEGLDYPPLLRSAVGGEARPEPGSTVELSLRPSAMTAILRVPNVLPTASLSDVCRWLCPALDVDVMVSEDGSESSLAVEANRWLRVDAATLVADTTGQDRYRTDAELGAYLEERVREIRGASGELVGRACIPAPTLVSERPNVSGRVWVSDAYAGLNCGGLRSSRVRDMLGILVGRPMRAARDLAEPVASPEDLAQWATEQAALLSRDFSVASEPVSRDWVGVATMVRACGGETGGLPIAWSAEALLTYADVVRLAAAHEELRIGDWSDVAWALDPTRRDADRYSEAPWSGLAGDVLVTDHSVMSRLESTIGRSSGLMDWPPMEPDLSLVELVFNAVAAGWGTDGQTLWENVVQSYEEELLRSHPGMQLFALCVSRP